MTQLNQIVAIEKGVKSRSERVLTDAYHVVQKDALFGGLERTYQPRDEDGDALPPESTKVQQTVEYVLATAANALVRLFDVVLTKEVANTNAVADVKVGDQVLVSDAPITYLLFLEKKLVDLHTLVSKAPLLDPAEEWVLDSSGFYATRPTQTTRSKKVPRAFVKADATERHPAQVEVFTEDVIVGDWTLRKFSGKISRERQLQLLERIAALTEAVKFAREEANSIDVVDRHVGVEFFAYLLAP